MESNKIIKTVKLVPKGGILTDAIPAMIGATTAEKAESVEWNNFPINEVQTLEEKEE